MGEGGGGGRVRSICSGRWNWLGPEHFSLAACLLQGGGGGGGGEERERAGGGTDRRVSERRKKKSKTDRMLPAIACWFLAVHDQQ